jgi:3-hydroxyisobutyrate dehydrogenase-like beta-hydroxyacid dehydrogenase
MKVTILGAGHMGHAIGIRLLKKNYEVTVWNRSPGKTGDLERLGARTASTAGEAASTADVVMTLVTADAAVKHVALGEGGVVRALKPGAALVDMSTVSPDTSRELGLATPGGRFVDAPILGGPDATENGTAKLLLGGAEDVVQDLDPLWSDLASEYYYCGPNGSATTLKLLSNLMLVGETALLAEALATAQANGIDDDTLRTALKSSPAIAPGVLPRFEDVLAGDHNGWWSIYLAQKDMSLALQLATSKGMKLPLAEASVQALDAAERAGYGEKDLGAVVEPIRRPSRG